VTLLARRRHTKPPTKPTPLPAPARRRRRRKKQAVKTTEALIAQGLQRERATGVEPATSSLGKLFDEGPEDYDPWAYSLRGLELRGVPVSTSFIGFDRVSLLNRHRYRHQSSRRG